jgi:hypothetical protein
MGEIISTAYLMGGLGNQMFQMSHALCQGWKNNIPTKFRPSSYTPMQANQPTKYLDNIFRNDGLKFHRVIGFYGIGFYSKWHS